MLYLCQELWFRSELFLFWQQERGNGRPTYTCHDCSNLSNVHECIHSWTIEVFHSGSSPFYWWKCIWRDLDQGCQTYGLWDRTGPPRGPIWPDGQLCKVWTLQKRVRVIIRPSVDTNWALQSPSWLNWTGLQWQCKSRCLTSRWLDLLAYIQKLISRTNDFLHCDYKKNIF